MADAGDAILRSLGLQTDMYKRINASKRLDRAEERNSSRYMGQQLQKTAENLQKHRADQEVSELQNLFAASVASGKPENFAKASANMEFSQPEANAAQVKLLMAARGMGRQDEADERAEAEEARRAKQETDRGILFRQQQADRAVDREYILDERVESAKDRKDRREQNRLDTAERRANAKRDREIDERRLEALDYADGERDKADRIEEFYYSGTRAVEEKLGQLEQSGNKVDDYDLLEKQGYLDQAFPPNDPEAQQAKQMYRDSIVKEEAIERQRAKEQREEVRQITLENAQDVITSHGAKAQAQVFKSITAAVGSGEKDFTVVYGNAVASYTRWVDEQFTPGTIGHNTLLNEGLHALSERLGKVMGKYLEGENKQVSERDAQKAQQQEDEAVEEAMIKRYGIATTLTGTEGMDPEDVKARSDYEDLLRANYRNAIAARRSGAGDAKPTDNGSAAPQQFVPVDLNAPRSTINVR